MNRAAVDSPLENKHSSALRILGIFLDHDRRPGAREELIHREAIISESVVAVLGYSNVSGGDQAGELLPQAGHLAISGFSVLTHNGSNQRLATLDIPSGPILSRVRCIAWLAPASKQQVVLRVAPNPNPDDFSATLDR
jgi:hypothetical protein